MSFVQRVLVLGVMVAGATIVTAAPAHGQTRASCAVRQVLGKEDRGGLSPEIKFLARQLQQAPFTAWQSFKYLGRTDLQMSKDEPKELVLATGRHKLQLTYLGREGKQLRLRLLIGPKYLDVTYRIGSGGTFLQVGLPHDGGTVIIATTCKG
jgi:hypothetical protein